MLYIIFTFVVIYLVFRHCSTNQPETTQEQSPNDETQRLTPDENASEVTSTSTAKTPTPVTMKSMSPSRLPDAKVHTVKPVNASRASIAPITIPKTFTFSPRHQIVGIVESVNWCNHLMRICWPHIGKIVESQLSPVLEPLINLHLPKPFSKFRFTKSKLGKDPLTIDRVTVHKRHCDSIALDMDVTFIGHPNISMKCAPLNAPFGIRELKWSGRLVILLRPLLAHLPLIGAIQISMIKSPDLQMDFTGVANIAEFGPIERIVKTVLKDVISSMLVLPNRFGYVVSESIDYFSVYQDPVGIMKITIQRGRGFTKEKKIGMIKSIPDLYCVGQFSLESMKTNVQYNNLIPEWGTSKSFILSDLEQLFQLSVYDKDAITRDDLGGSLTVTAKDLLKSETKWYPLTDNIDEKFAKNGEVYLTSQLYQFKDPKEPVKGLCVFSILIDKATNLPSDTRSASCRVTIGTDERQVVRETPAIKKPKEPIPGIDPVNPVWNFSFDILCDDYATSDATIEVISGKKSLGEVTINAKELESTDFKVKKGEFPIGNGAMLRAKVLLRGVAPGKLPSQL